MPNKYTLQNTSLSTLNGAALGYAWGARQAGCVSEGATVATQPLPWLGLSTERTVSSPD